MFIVMETSLTYNDEIYGTTGTDGGMPSKLFNDKQEAELYARELNAQKIVDLIVEQQFPFSYCYNLEDICELDDDELQTNIQQITGKTCIVNDNDINIGCSSGDLSSEQKIAIAALFNLEFYFVAECE